MGSPALPLRGPGQQAGGRQISKIVQELRFEKDPDRPYLLHAGAH